MVVSDAVDGFMLEVIVFTWRCCNVVGWIWKSLAVARFSFKRQTSVQGRTKCDRDKDRTKISPSRHFKMWF